MSNAVPREDIDSEIEIHYSSGTDAGIRREANEDAYVCFRVGKFVVACVADGVGGVIKGPIASSLAVETIQKHLESLPTISSSSELRDSIAKANREIFERTLMEPSLAGMGTTIGMVALSPDKAFIANVGNTRVYRIREDVMEQLTEDHTLAAELEKSQAGFSSKPNGFPTTHILTRCVGKAPDIEVDDKEIDKPEDQERYFVCSDGLYDLVGEDEIVEILLETPLEDMPMELIDLANSRGGTDNITVVGLTIGEIEPDLFGSHFSRASRSLEDERENERESRTSFLNRHEPAIGPSMGRPSIGRSTRHSSEQLSSLREELLREDPFFEPPSSSESSPIHKETEESIQEVLRRKSAEQRGGEAKSSHHETRSREIRSPEARSPWQDYDSKLKEIEKILGGTQSRSSRSTGPTKINSDGVMVTPSQERPSGASFLGRMALSIAIGVIGGTLVSSGLFGSMKKPNASVVASKTGLSNDADSLLGDRIGNERSGVTDEEINQEYTPRISEFQSKPTLVALEQIVDPDARAMFTEVLAAFAASAEKSEKLITQISLKGSQLGSQLDRLEQIVKSEENQVVNARTAKEVMNQGDEPDNSK